MKDATHGEATRKDHLHFVGIAGAGMRGVARCFRSLGHPVTGSDARRDGVAEALEDEGIPVGPDRDASIPSDAELVVRTAAVDDEHPQIRAARERGVPVLEYAEALQRLMARGRGVAVTGTHGKTTTSAMTAHVFREAGRDPSWVIGGNPPSLGTGAHVGEGREFVVEACEYRRSFLHLRPAVAITTTIEPDHLDCYRDLEEIRSTFRSFFDECLPGGGLVIGCGDDPEVRRAVADLSLMVETYGLSDLCDWRIRDVDLTGGRPTFSVDGPDGPIADLGLRVPGMHNVQNATAAAACAFRLGIAPSAIRDALASFPGVDRRFQVLRSGEVVVLDDYAHHPTEIRCVLRAVRQRWPDRRILAVFEAHQYSRTHRLMDRFRRAFEEADRVLIPEIYACRDSEEDIDAVSALDLTCAVAEEGRDARYIPTYGGVIDHLVRESRPGDVVCVMGAGPVTAVAHEVARKLG